MGSEVTHRGNIGVIYGGGRQVEGGEVGGVSRGEGGGRTGCAAEGAEEEEEEEESGSVGLHGPRGRGWEWGGEGRSHLLRMWGEGRGGGEQLRAKRPPAWGNLGWGKEPRPHSRPIAES